MYKRKDGLVNKSLVVSLRTIENCVVSEGVEEIIITICDAEFGAKLFLNQVPSLEYCKEISAAIVRNFQESK